MQQQTYFTELNFETLKQEQQELPSKIKLLPKSPFAGRNGFAFNYDFDELLEKFKTEGLQIPIDINHATELKAPLGEHAPAIAWITNLEQDLEGNVWGTVDWLDDWYIKGKQYKYISPVMQVNNKGKFNRITSVGLTNKPNLRGLGALNHETENKNQEQGEQKMLGEISKSLGLSESASEQDIINKIAELNNNAKENQALNSELSTKVTKLNSEITNIKAKELNDKKTLAIDNAVAQGKIAPATKEYHFKAINSEEGLNDFIKAMQKAPALLKQGVVKEPTENKEILNSEESKICKEYGFDAEEFKKEKQRIFNTNNQ